MGKKIHRVDAYQKSTGRAVYSGDINIPGMLVGKILRSHVPHARIISINTDKAQLLPGVMAVISAKDFPDKNFGFIIKDETAMAKDKIRYYGESVAAVAAIDENTALKALELIELEIDELPAITDFDQSVDETALRIHDNSETYVSRFPVSARGNVCYFSRLEKGDLEQGFAESDEIFEDTFTLPVVHQAGIEPRAVVAEVERNGKIHVWCSTQASFSIRSGLAEVLDRPMTDIQVTGTFVGGAFGSKDYVTIEHIAAMLAMKSGKPVKLVMTREEDFISINPRHSMEIRLRTGVKKDGRLMAREAYLRIVTGAYAYFAPLTTKNATNLIIGPYHIPNILVEGTCVYTNTLSCGPCRGPGGPQTHFATESQLDRIARKLGIDPIELRKKNIIQENQTTASKEKLPENRYAQVLDRLKIGINEQLRTLSPAHKAKAFGIGMAGCFWGMSAPGGCGATIKLNEDGTVILLMGCVETGAGSHTAMALLISEALDIPINKIRVIGGDTDVCPFDAGAVSSRTSWSMGDAVHQAISGVKARLLSFAETELNVLSENLTFKDGNIMVKDNPEVFVSISSASRRLVNMMGSPVIASAGSTAPGVRYYTFGAQAVAVEVDRETGKVDVLKVLAVHDVGKAIFKDGIEGQIQGGVAMGLGYALSEEVIFSDGKPINTSFLDYRLQTATDLPEIIPIIMEKENPQIPNDIRGIGEPPTVPTAAAVANAIYDAVGIRLNRVPMTPERVYNELKRKNRS